MKERLELLSSAGEPITFLTNSEVISFSLRMGGGEYGKESIAREGISSARERRRHEEYDLRIAYNLCKNLTEAFVGERNKEELKKYLTTGSYLEKAIYLRNRLKANTEILQKVGEHNLEEMEKAIAEYQEAVSDENTTENKLEAADEQTDALIQPLGNKLHVARLYIKAWLVSINKPELYSEFVKPRKRSGKRDETVKSTENVV